MDQGVQRSIKRKPPYLEHNEQAKRPKLVVQDEPLFSLHSAMASAEKTSKAKESNDIERLYTIKNQLKRLLDDADRTEIAQSIPVEVEARIGTYNNSSFTSEIPERLFRCLSQILTLETSLSPQPDRIEIDYIFPQDTGNIRVTTDKDENILTTICKKRMDNKIFSELPGFHLHFAVRVSSSTEEVMDNTLSIGSGWEIRREKKRETWRNVGIPSKSSDLPIIPWTIELTTVVATIAPRANQPTPTPVITYELELELPRNELGSIIPLDTRASCLMDGIFYLLAGINTADSSPSQAIHWNAPSERLLRFRQYTPQHNTPARPSSSTNPPPNRTPVIGKVSTDENRHAEFPFMDMEKVDTGQNFKHAILAAHNSLRADMQKSTFIGTMPVNFSRKNLRNVLNNDYWISEKTDGIRFMMLITTADFKRRSTRPATRSTSNVFVTDRTNSWFWVPEFSKQLGSTGLSIADHLGQSGATFIDGEMVKRFDSDNKYYFLIFDAIVVEGHQVQSSKVMHRLHAIRSFVDKFTQIVNNHTNSVPNNNLNLPFTLLQKEIVPKYWFELVSGRLQDIKGTTVYGDRDSSHFHLTDGLIFMPESPYPYFTCEHMYKWKYPDRLTIDFEVELGQSWSDPINMLVGGNSRTTALCRRANLTKENWNRLNDDISSCNITDQIIAEMGFDSATGQWTYHKLRPDKNAPNYIVTAEDTLESICENLQLLEVLQALKVSRDHHYAEENALAAARNRLLSERPSLLNSQDPIYSDSGNHHDSVQ